MINITLGDKHFKVDEAASYKDRRNGLQGVTELAPDEGMIFYFEDPDLVEMWMKDTLIPLDIIFINSDQEVTAVEQGQPNDPTLLGHEDTLYVVEVNQGSGVKVGDELEFDDDKAPTMKVLAPDGSTQMELEGGERIVSRRETKVLISKAYRARESHNDKDYKALGRYIFKVFKKQDSREPEYVQQPTSKP